MIWPLSGRFKRAFTQVLFYAWSSDRKLRDSVILSSALIIFLIYSLLQNIFLVLDYLIFPFFNKIEINKPVFIVGMPRSGTTLLHRTLAADRKNFTTFTLWEILFAPSILQKKMFISINKIDKLAGGKLKKVFLKISGHFLAVLGNSHKTQVVDPEEDFMLLIPIAASFMLVNIFPVQIIKELNCFDEMVPEKEKTAIMEHYKALIQRHMFVFGKGRRYLSKNASFCSYLPELKKHFSDGGFILTIREPFRALRSLQNIVRNGAITERSEPEIFGLSAAVIFASVSRIKEFTSLFKPAGVCRLYSMERIKNSLYDTVIDIYRFVNISMGDAFSEKLFLMDENARKFKSRHKYN
ncbi:MAG: sulfotransferase [Fibrobacterota bacterium]